MVQVLDKKGRKKRHSPQPFSENTFNIPLQNSINSVLRFHSPTKRAGNGTVTTLSFLQPCCFPLIHHVPEGIILIQKYL